MDLLSPILSSLYIFCIEVVLVMESAVSNSVGGFFNNLWKEVTFLLICESIA